MVFTHLTTHGTCLRKSNIDSELSHTMAIGTHAIDRISKPATRIIINNQQQQHKEYYTQPYLEMSHANAILIGAHQSYSRSLDHL